MWDIAMRNPSYLMLSRHNTYCFHYSLPFKIGEIIEIEAKRFNNEELL